MLIRPLIYKLMKKRIYLILLSISAIFFSCKDNNEFVEQLFTNKEISAALKQCIDSTAFRTCNVLCVVDSSLIPTLGYSHYDSKSYRLELPLAAKKVIDTLKQYGFDTNIDTLLINNINHAAELCGNDLIRQFWRVISDTVVFQNPNAVFRGGDNALTNFLKQTIQTEFINVLVNNILLEQFKELQIITTWNELQKEYYDKTGNYSTIDILTPTAQQMVAGFFRKMALEEEAIRKDPAKRGNPKSLLYRVFATL